MISDEVSATMAALGLKLDRIDFASNSTHVVVGLVNNTGTRWIGRTVRMALEPELSLNEAFEDALDKFDSEWRERVEKVSSS